VSFVKVIYIKNNRKSGFKLEVYAAVKVLFNDLSYIYLPNYYKAEKYKLDYYFIKFIKNNDIEI
jgi:hypothetical protein